VGPREPASDRAHAALALVYTALALTTLEFWFHPCRVEARLRDLPFGRFAAPSLDAGLIWAAGSSLAYVVFPLLIVLFVHKSSPRAVGYQLGGFLRHLWVYLALYLFMLPFVLKAAGRDDFLSMYPFVGSAAQSREHFLIWESAYLLQFFALESFFRGYLLFTLEKAMGWLAVFAMAVPYCMIHYHKPPLEAFGAVVAGLALGALALRFRSWLGGAVLHCLVAFTMDALAAHQRGLF